MASEISLSDMVVTHFERVGISDAFIVTGGAIAGFTESLAKSKKIKCHYLLTEQSASIAAEAYGHYDGTPALLVTTSGPGVTNALTGVVAAWTNSTPLIVVSGQARSMDVLESRSTKSRQVGNQHIDTISLVSTITKLCMEPVELFNSHKVVNDLFTTSITGRQGPVWLSFPSDIQRKRVELDIEVNRLVNPQVVFNSDSSDFQSKIIQLFKDSMKPAVLIGNGARQKGTLPIVIYDFLVRNKIPVVTTWPALDMISEVFPLYFGRPGTIASSYVANYLVQECDALLILGARLDLAQIGFRPNDFAAQAKVLRVDIDDQEFLRIPARPNWVNYKGSVPDLLPVFDLEKYSFNHDSWLESLDQKKKIETSRGIEKFDDGISTYKVIEALGQVGIDNIVCGSSGTCVEMVLQTWPTALKQRFVFSCGLGSMGFGLAAAIGIAAKTKKQVLLLESDGSLAMNIQDFETISRLGLNIKIAILDSGGYKSIKLSQNRQNQFQHGTDEITGVYLPNPTKWAFASDIDARDVFSSDELSDSIVWLLNSELPRLINIHVSASEEATPRLISKVNQNGVMETAEYSDLWPRIN
jgi:acetolactate synthase I/II/III large subunit